MPISDVPLSYGEMFTLGCRRVLGRRFALIMVFAEEQVNSVVKRPFTDIVGDVPAFPMEDVS